MWWIAGCRWSLLTSPSPSNRAATQLARGSPLAITAVRDCHCSVFQSSRFCNNFRPSHGPRYCTRSNIKTGEGGGALLSQQRSHLPSGFLFQHPTSQDCLHTCEAITKTEPISRHSVPLALRSRKFPAKMDRIKEVRRIPLVAAAASDAASTPPWIAGVLLQGKRITAMGISPARPAVAVCRPDGNEGAFLLTKSRGA